MRHSILATAAAATLLLSGCCSTPEGESGYHDWPASNTVAEGPVPGSVEDFKKIGDRVFFGFDQYDLKEHGIATVKMQAEWLNKWPSVGAVIEGHADERGTVEYNLALGERRANAVKKALMAHGVHKDRLEVVSYGKEHPAVEGHHEAAWSQNRRAVTTIR